MCVSVYDSPISCFSPYVLWMPFLGAIISIISWTTHTHLHLMHRHTVACCTFLCTFSGSLCQTGGPLSSLSVCGPIPAHPLLFISTAACLTCTHKLSAKRVAMHMQTKKTHCEFNCWLMTGVWAGLIMIIIIMITIFYVVYLVITCSYLLNQSWS